MLGIDRATVLRATAELCKADGLFDRVTHGGRGNRTAYLPRWDRLNAIVDDWDLRMKDGSPPSKVAKLRRSRSQDCDVDSRRTATQTDRRNRQKEPTEPSREKKGPVSVDASERQEPKLPSKPKGMHGLGSGGVQTDPRRFLLHPLPGGKAGVAKEAAIARIMRQVRADNPSLAYRIDCEATPEMLAEAAKADAAQRGAGVPMLISLLMRAKATSGGETVPDENGFRASTP